MPCGVRRSDCSTCVAGCRLDPQSLEWSLAQYPSIAHAVQSNTTRQAEIFCAGFAMYRAAQAQHDFFSDLLHGARKIHLALGQWTFRFAGWTIEQRIELAVGHCQSGAVVEV